MLSSSSSRFNGPFCNENRGSFCEREEAQGDTDRAVSDFSVGRLLVHQLNNLILPRQYIKCTCLLISEQRKGTIRERQSEDEPKNEASSDQSDQTRVARHPRRVASYFSSSASQILAAALSMTRRAKSSFRVENIARHHEEHSQQS